MASIEDQFEYVQRHWAQPFTPSSTRTVRWPSSRVRTPLVRRRARSVRVRCGGGRRAVGHQLRARSCTTSGAVYAFAPSIPELGRLASSDTIWSTCPNRLGDARASLVRERVRAAAATAGPAGRRVPVRNAWASRYSTLGVRSYRSRYSSAAADRAASVGRVEPPPGLEDQRPLVRLASRRPPAAGGSRPPRPRSRDRARRCRRCARTVARTWTSALARGRRRCPSASWFSRSASSNRPCSTCSVASPVQPAAEQVRGVEVPGERDGLVRRAAPPPRARPWAAAVTAAVRHLVGDAGPVAQLDGDPQRVGEAPGRPVVVTLVPVDLAHVADRQARGLPEPDLLGHLERPPSVREGGQVLAGPRVGQREVVGGVQQAAAVGRPVRRVERLPEELGAPRRAVGTAGAPGPAWLIAMLTPARSPMSGRQRAVALARSSAPRRRRPAGAGRTSAGPEPGTGQRRRRGARTRRPPAAARSPPRRTTGCTCTGRRGRARRRRLRPDGEHREPPPAPPGRPARPRPTGR